MIRLTALLARQAPWLLGMAVLTSVGGGLATTGVLIVVLDALHDERGATVWLFTTLVVLAIGGRGGSRLFAAAATRIATFSVRQRLAEAIAAIALADVERLGGIRLRGAMTGDVGHLGTTLPIIVNVLSSASFLFACLGYLAWLEPSGMIGIIGTTAIGVGCYLMFHRRVRRFALAGRQNWDEIVGSCSLLVNGSKQIKADSRRRDDVLQTMARQARAGMRVWARHAWSFNLAIVSTQILFYAALGIVIFAPRIWGMSSNEVLRFGLAIVYMAGPLREVVTALPELADAEVAYGRIVSLDASLKAVRRQVASVDIKDLSPTWSQIEVAEVSMRYGSADNPKFSLSPLSFAVRRGEIIFIVGGNGTGKTTLAKILTGLYAATAGEVLVDGVPVDAEHHDWYLHQFTAIFADFVLFQRVCLVDTDAARARAASLLHRLEMDGKVAVDDLRLSRTTGLSSGERKRLALLEACLSNRPAMLFDEWAADQDPRFKELFYREFLPEFRAMGKAVIVISHDDRYFDVADTIVFLERSLPGRVERRVRVAEVA